MSSPSPSVPAAAHPADLSVVLVTPDRFRNIRTTFRHLREQTVRDRLEIVLVAPSAEALEDRDRDAFDGFARVAIVPVGRVDSLDAAIAQGILRSTAPVVAHIEDHAYPEPGWAEALIRRHREPWAGVGYLMVNANPRTMLSWASLLLGYGPWCEVARGGEVVALPGHNVSYKRELLVAYGDRLARMLSRGGGLHGDLRAQGHRLFLDEEARVKHVNPSRATSTLALAYVSGRVHGAAAARSHWTPLRRVLYLVGSPLVPVVNLKRLVKTIFDGGRRAELVPRVIPALFLSLVFDAVGQMVGNAFGAGDAEGTLEDFELDRPSHLCASDRALLGVAE